MLVGKPEGYRLHGKLGDESIEDLPCAGVSKEHSASIIRADEAVPKL
jgi:hypothetical protein